SGSTKARSVMARAKYGQNFLTSEEWQKTILSYFHPPAEFGEIGPGASALTQHLVEEYKHFTVFEIDPKLAERHRHAGKYDVVEGDFLDWDFTLKGSPVENYSFVGN